MNLGWVIGFTNRKTTIPFEYNGVNDSGRREIHILYPIYE